jgi:hypothetical protein
MAGKTKTTEDDMESLTAEELAGLKELQEEEAAEAAEEARLAAEGGEEEEAAEEQPDAKKPETEAEPEKTVEEPEKAAEEVEKDVGEDLEATTEADVVEAEPEKVKIIPKWEVPAEDKARAVEIDTQLDAIAEKFDEGELTAKEMREQQKPLLAEQRALDRKMTRAELSEASAVDVWREHTVPSFIAAHDEYKPGSMRFKLLDQTVRELQAANGDNPTNPQILADAHAAIVAELGEVGKAPKPAARAKNGKDANGEERELPPSISKVPAADHTEAARSNEFIQLERLTGVAYENAMRKLTPDQRERYLAQG